MNRFTACSWWGNSLMERFHTDRGFVYSSFVAMGDADSTDATEDGDAEEEESEADMGAHT
jgi:hypothetical protein